MAPHTLPKNARFLPSARTSAPIPAPLYATTWARGRVSRALYKLLSQPRSQRRAGANPTQLRPFYSLNPPWVHVGPHGSHFLN
jgi:hypothetical protein